MPKKRPWRKFPAVDHVVVEWAGAPAMERFDMDEDPDITPVPELIDKRVLFAQRRCSLAHELEHLDRGDDACLDDRAENMIRLSVARKLIPWHDLIDGVAAGLTADDLADALAVTEEVLTDRIRFLHPAEKMLVASAAHRTDRDDSHRTVR